MKFEIGSTVTIKVRNPIYGSHHRHASYMNISEFNEFTGVVMGGHKAIGPSQIGLSTGDPHFKMRIIDIDRIVSSDDSIIEAKQDDVWTVEGSKGSLYTVSRTGNRYDCTCPGYQFRKRCRHVDQYVSV